ncbi:hypothetical protein DFH06DRAFT_1265431 [Mycena polygramma]|nr:hypothetical protein DFH06DRAFT_1265431 [Mycena polygramma]
MRLATLSLVLLVSRAVASVADPCAAIAGKKWVSPLEARSCLFSFPVDEDIKNNIIQVVNKSLPFHTSVNYQILAPHPFDKEVHEDIAADVAQIKETSYPSDFHFHLDLYSSFRRLNDGHCTIFNFCYDSLYISYLPTPLVLLAASDGSQSVHIAPEAFSVASAEFPDQIEFWQDSLPGNLKGKLASLSGAKVLKINGKDPFIAVDENAKVTGGYQAFGTRQNLFFSSYSRGPNGYTYNMGQFALQIHPLTDLVDLTIQRINSSSTEQVSVSHCDTLFPSALMIDQIPYRSRFGSAAKNFTDRESYRANNCVNVRGTNGYNVYDLASVLEHAHETVPPVAYVEQQPTINNQDRRRPINVVLDATPLSDIDLPKELLPTTVVLPESYSVAQFHLLPDDITGVLALGSFSAANFTVFMGSLLDGLQELKHRGASRLIVDVVRYICIAHPQAGLDTCTRAGSLAQLIVEKINQGADPGELLSYNPSQWKNSSHVPYSLETHWLRPTVNLTINGHKDAFSPRLGQECQPFEIAPPDHGLFDPQKIAIVSNGHRRLNLIEPENQGVKTVVIGGHQDVPQQYCGVVGGQSTHFAEIDTEIKTNSVLGITWRLGFGLNDPKEPEVARPPPDFSLPLTMSIVNKPAEIWAYTASMVFSTDVVAGPTDSAQVYFP